MVIMSQQQMFTLLMVGINRLREISNKLPAAFNVCHVLTAQHPLPPLKFWSFLLITPNLYAAWDSRRSHQWRRRSQISLSTLAQLGRHASQVWPTEYYFSGLGVMYWVTL